MNSIAATKKTTLKRHPERGSFDPSTIYRILDEAMIAHVGFPSASGTLVLPMAYGRIEDKLYFHGAVANHMLNVLASGVEVCVTVTLLDGLVLARSAFHHSMNYRSVVLLGPAQLVEDPNEKKLALTALMDHITHGRSRESRPANAEELRATLLLRLPIHEGSAKIRRGPPVDAPADYALPHWAGVVPLKLSPQTPIVDPKLDSSVPLPASVQNLTACDSVERPIEQECNGRLLSTDSSRLDLGWIHHYLTHKSYWAQGLSRQHLQRSIEHSLCVGLYRDRQQLGFARIVTDFRIIAYLCDFFVDPSQQGQGYGRQMIEFIHGLPGLEHIGRWLLGTKDAHQFYEKYGWIRFVDGENFMTISLPNDLSSEY